MRIECKLRQQQIYLDNVKDFNKLELNGLITRTSGIAKVKKKYNSRKTSDKQTVFVVVKKKYKGT